MFEIEANYQSLTKINSISSELKGLMVLYGRFVAHDKHLLSYILKDLSTNRTRETIRSLEDIKRINPFGTDTLTMVTAESGKIRWASNNAAPLFGYNENEFKCLTIA